ncbi:proline-rich receptor-like protein kinase PERK12 [Drosophila rhopaloa]|uniref:Proline-rich receptor-like protein kinase PERK12 n=1 Tax=Drosophila rhopaloa TaxID=1041015 RepID=A0A6P4F566_DRORH|nr:proline-rich receptor-like protein kinase PERK12 [Drosophila rhopaloa]
MSTDPDKMASDCADPGAQIPANKESSVDEGQVDPAASSCSFEKQKDSTDMDIDNDLTTNERMPTVDELEQPKQPKSKPREVKKEQEQEPKTEPEQEQKPMELPIQPPSPPPSAIKMEEEDKPVKLPSQIQEEIAPSSPEAPPNPSQQRPVGKITRSSLNGNQGSQVTTTTNRTPTIMKRLRKSTRFKAKQTGKGNSGSSNSQSNGHNNGPNGSTGSSTHLAGAGAHPSNTNKHGKSGPAGPGGATGARNRRSLFKRPAQKTPKVQACTKFVKSVFYKGSYMQIGDIVSIVDGDQNLYYAQVRGLLVDAYCEKSAFLTWLIPTQDSPDPQEGFDPATYLIGPDEELSRKLCYLEFVMHAPSNYYFDRSTPFPLPDVDEYTAQRSGGYIWTRLPVVKREKGSGLKTGGAS